MRSQIFLKIVGTVKTIRNFQAENSIILCDRQKVGGWLDESGRIAEAVEPVVFDKSFKLPVFDNTPVEIDIKQVPKEAEEEDLLAGVQ